MNTPVFETAAIRESVVRSLEEAEVEIRPFFYPLHDQPPYRDGSPNSESVAMDLYERGLNLPSSPLLRDEEIHTVCQAVRDAL
jgi:perosamine synthetase